MQQHKYISSASLPSDVLQITAAVTRSESFPAVPNKNNFHGQYESRSGACFDKN